MTPTQYLDLAAIAEMAGIERESIKTYHKRAAANRAAGNPRPGDLPQEDIRLGRTPGWDLRTIEKWLIERPRPNSRAYEWTSHPGLLGLLAEMGISVDRVLPSPRIKIWIERDRAKGARSVARYQFTVYGRYPDGNIVPIADGQADLTEFDQTRVGEWTLP